jgi:hypothetical protein
LMDRYIANRSLRVWLGRRGDLQDFFFFRATPAPAPTAGMKMTLEGHGDNTD